MVGVGAIARKMRAVNGRAGASTYKFRNQFYTAWLSTASSAVTVVASTQSDAVAFRTKPTRSCSAFLLALPESPPGARLVGGEGNVYLLQREVGRLWLRKIAQGDTADADKGKEAKCSSERQ